MPRMRAVVAVERRMLIDWLSSIRLLCFVCQQSLLVQRAVCEKCEVEDQSPICTEKGTWSRSQSSTRDVDALEVDQLVKFTLGRPLMRLCS